MLAAAPAYSALVGILGGFLSLGILTLMTERRYRDRSKKIIDKALTGARARDGRTIIDRSRTLMLFLPAFLCLLVSSFVFGEVSGDQVCTRGPRIAHAQWVEDPLAQDVLERGPRGAGCQDSEHLRPGLVQPPLAGLASSGNSPSRAFHVSGSGIAAGCGGPKVYSSRSAAAVTIGHCSGPVNMAPCIPNPQVKVSRSRTVMDR